MPAADFFTDAQVAEAITYLTAGEVIAAPAEGVYGYCADPFNPRGLEKLLALKQRDPKKGFVILVPGLKTLGTLCPPFSCAIDDLFDLHWPGQTTLVLPALPTVPYLLTGGRGTVAVRLPKAPHVLRYLKPWGRALVSTSANLTGEAPITDGNLLPADVFALKLPQPLPGGVSRVIDARTGERLR